MWIETQSGKLVETDKACEIYLSDWISDPLLWTIRFGNREISHTLFEGSLEDCKKIFQALSEKLGATSITNLLYDEPLLLDPVEAIRNLMERRKNENNDLL